MLDDRQPRELCPRSVNFLLRHSYSRGQGMAPVQKDLQTQFYKEYRKVAEEYDKEFIKIYDDDLNTTLIFVSPPSHFLDTC